MKQLFSSITKKEWAVVAVFSVIVIVITTVPYLYGYLAAPAGTTYDGLHVLSPGDVPIYYSYINQAKHGEFFAKDLFTAEPENLGTFNIWWNGVGLLAAVFNLSAPVAFQLSRILMIPVFMVVAYLFLAYFFVAARVRQLALGFLVFSSGLGVLLAGPVSLLNLPDTGVYYWPIDLWISEAVTFNALFQTSHFIASIGLTLLIFLLFLLSFEQNKLRYSVVAGLLSLIYFNFHPYYFPVIFGVVGLYAVALMFQAGKILWHYVWYTLLAFIISLPSIGYHVWLLKSSSAVADRALQNVTTISPLVFVLFGYGFLWLGAVVGVWLLAKHKKISQRHLLLLLWLVVNVFLIYSPFPFHSRYTQGLHVVLVIFTVAGLLEIYSLAKQRLNPKRFDFWVNNPALLGMLFVICFMPSIFYGLFRDFYLFSQSNNNTVNKTFFLSNDLYAAGDFLAHQPTGAVVLAADIPAKFIPGWSGQKVFLAHAHETLFYYSKLPYLLWFYADNQNSSAKKRFLQTRGIDYVLYSQYEKELGSFDPAQASFLRLVFDRPNVQVYQLVTN